MAPLEHLDYPDPKEKQVELPKRMVPRDHPELPVALEKKANKATKAKMVIKAPKVNRVKLATLAKLDQKAKQAHKDQLAYKDPMALKADVITALNPVLLQDTKYFNNNLFPKILIIFSFFANFLVFQKNRE